MRFWTDAAFQKDTTGETNGTPWHNDYCTWPFWGEQLPILWLALTDVGMEDAPLQTLQGSHSEPHRYYSWLSPKGLETSDMYHPWQELLDKVAAPGAPIKTWTVRAGDCLLMHPKIIHSSLPRTTTRPGRRLALSTRWLGDDAVWAPDAYTPMGEYLTREPDMVHGRAPSSRLFPILWQRESAAELA
jgi:ectoine hydroxylase-related dioxygenase (phytanoyl-CoA dioxygenase family)